ncbi:ankyrin repeat domain-containing protein, partial [Staphylococcus aureus]|uniref:ankyrin repeat domain-containing protein n=1 Tax=Staphylococcus aureus TaxID=1280 RepID=UPI0021AEBD2E
MEQGANIETSGVFMKGTPLFNAAARGYEAIVKLLIEKGANIEARNGSGETPLYSAVHSRFEGIVKLLVKNGADIRAKNMFGETPLSIAKERRLT